MKPFLILETAPGKDYELLDSGDGEKLERYGAFTLSRPDPQALWPKRLGQEIWGKAHGKFIQSQRGGRWDIQPGTPGEWQISLGGLRFLIKPTAFKHTGIFPEQSTNWAWLAEKIATAPRPVRVLNLFSYTGGATLAAAKAGAEVVHLDASKSAVGWARRNAEVSGLAERPIRWIVDDAPTFLRREAKRGNKYEGIIMDPPAFGHGPGGELWKIEEHLLDLFAACRAVLSEHPLFFLVNGYASGYSAIAYENNLAAIIKDFKGEISIGELVIRESDRQTADGGGRLLPAGIFARWSAP
ncbi:MAG: class I SAM-dependent methyltransferase [Proteobacteria bacterium]|nr:class I SAM-dependent methyltransferase [Pseudomonadota bacterium]